MVEKRIDAAEYGIDLEALLEEIRPHLARMTQQQIADAAGVRQPYVANILAGKQKPSIAALAALAHAAGGRLDVKFHPPRKRKAKG